MDIKKERECRGILIAAHRGCAGGNIACNTIEAFEAALQQGADILEMDLFRTTDERLYLFHTGKERVQLNRDIDVTKLSSTEIKKLHYVNSDFFETEQCINDLDDVLEALKGRCLLNLDRCWNDWGLVKKYVERHGMREQVILKSHPDEKYFEALEEIAPDYMYMPILTESDVCMESLEKRRIRLIGAECVFASEDSEVVSAEFISKMKSKGMLLWGNAILYSYQVPLSAGHSDDISVTGHPDAGWGWLADRGFDMIQTDWPGMLKNYLSKRCERCPAAAAENSEEKKGKEK